MSKLDQSFANHYMEVAALLTENNLLLDNEKNKEARAVMKEAARCLKESAARLIGEEDTK